MALAACLAIAYLFNQMLGGWRPVGLRDRSVGKKLEHLELIALTGDNEPVDLASLKGKATVVNFWGTWCLPCRAEFPQLLDVQAKLGSDPRFQLVLVSYPSDERSVQELRENTAKFLAHYRTSIGVFHDPGNATAVALGDVFLEPIGFPTTILLDSEGVIRAAWRGASPNIGQEIETNVRRLFQFQAR